MNSVDPKFTQEQKAKACEEILASIAKGKSLIATCRADDWLPAESTFRLWCDKDADLAASYARACEVRADAIFEEIFDIADDNQHDTRVNADGVELLNSDHVQRAKLRIDARKWALSKMQPKKYGDKLDVNHDGKFTVTITGDDANL